MNVDVMLWTLLGIFLSYELFLFMREVSSARKRHRSRKMCETFRRARK